MMDSASGALATLKDNLSAAIFGQEELIDDALCCLLSGGHMLMTGAPGLAKTTLVRVLAHNMGLAFGRIQFTPDLLPTDVMGSVVLDIDSATGKRTFHFQKGPVFTNLLLADEINRASPRTQSALLEAMQERTVTSGDTTHVLDAPFMVFATQNPLESEGTFPLPEAQLDRFLVHSLVPYPTSEGEKKILSAHVEGTLAGEQRSWEDGGSISAEQVRQLIAESRAVKVSSEIVDLIAELVRATRPDEEECPDGVRGSLLYGAGPRAGISLISLTRSLAFIRGDKEVRWRHVERMMKPCFRHRVALSLAARRDLLNEDAVIDQVVDHVKSRLGSLVKDCT